jgi:molybdate transport system substrate-binding protein
MKKFTLVSLLCCCMLLTACQEQKTEITISAASSLTDVLEDVAIRYEEKHPNIDVLINTGGSGALGQQLKQGAPVDVFISASSDVFERLVKEEIIDSKESVELFTNEIVLIEHVDQLEEEHATDLSEYRNIAIGTPETVPAGKYAKQSLQAKGQYEQVKDRFVYAKDVRQVLHYVETKNVDAGIVYLTDAMQSTKVKVNQHIELSGYEPIIYPAGVIKATEHRKQALDFLAFLQQEEIQAIYKEYGFITE